MSATLLLSVFFVCGQTPEPPPTLLDSWAPPPAAEDSTAPVDPLDELDAPDEVRDRPARRSTADGEWKADRWSLSAKIFLVHLATPLTFVVAPIIGSGGVFAIHLAVGLSALIANLGAVDAGSLLLRGYAAFVAPVFAILPVVLAVRHGYLAETSPPLLILAVAATVAGVATCSYLAMRSFDPESKVGEPVGLLSAASLGIGLPLVPLLLAGPEKLDLE
jgi:hypothetical protein